MSSCLSKKQREELMAKLWDPDRPKFKAAEDREKRVANRLAKARGEKIPLTGKQWASLARRAEARRRALEAAR